MFSFTRQLSASKGLGTFLSKQLPLITSIGSTASHQQIAQQPVTATNSHFSIVAQPSSTRIPTVLQHINTPAHNYYSSALPVYKQQTSFQFNFSMQQAASPRTDFMPQYSWVSEDLGPMNDFRFEDNRRVVVILHGLMGCKANWRSFTKKLSRNFPHWKFLSVDIRNHGKSMNADGPHTIQNCAADIVNLIEDLNIEPAVVCGHSFGGKVAMEYAKQANSTPRKVVIMDTFPGSVEPQKGLAGSFGNVSIPSLLNILQAVPTPLKSKRVLVDILKEHGLPCSIAQWMTTNLTSTKKGYVWRFDLSKIEQMYNSYCETDMWEFIADPPTSLDILMGEKSDRWTTDAMDKLEDQIVASINSRFFVVPNAGHWLHVDNPKGVSDCLEKSISEADRALWDEFY